MTEPAASTIYDRYESCNDGCGRWLCLECNRVVLNRRAHDVETHSPTASTGEALCTTAELIAAPVSTVIAGPSWNDEIYKKVAEDEWFAIAQDAPWSSKSLESRGPFHVLRRGEGTPAQHPAPSGDALDPEVEVLGSPDLPRQEAVLVEFLRAHVGCCVVMAAKEDLARALLASPWLAEQQATVLRDAADEVYREARWQHEKRIRVAAMSTERAEMVHGYAAERLAVVEQILRDRADSVETGAGT